MFEKLTRLFGNGFVTRHYISPTEKPSGVIDLRTLKEIAPYEKNGAIDYTRFNIDIGDKVFKFRVGSVSEGEKWVNGLQNWQEYFLLNMRG